MNKKNLLIVLIAFAFVACEQASDQVVSMPNVEIQCQETGCNAGLSGDTVFVVVTKSGCANADFEDVAGGDATVTCNTSGCIGTVSSWIDGNGSSVTEIITGSYDVCAYIDSTTPFTSQNDGEMMADESVNISSPSTIVLDSWSETN